MYSTRVCFAALRPLPWWDRSALRRPLSRCRRSPRGEGRRSRTPTRPRSVRCLEDSHLRSLLITGSSRCIAEIQSVAVGLGDEPDCFALEPLSWRETSQVLIERPSLAAASSTRRL